MDSIYDHINQKKSQIYTFERLESAINDENV